MSLRFCLTNTINMKDFRPRLKGNKLKAFLNNQYTTKFIDNTPELFAFSERQDRATKLLNYIATVSIQGHPEIGKTHGPSIPTFSFRNPERNREDSSALNLKKMLDKRLDSGAARNVGICPIRETLF